MIFLTIKLHSLPSPTQSSLHFISNEQHPVLCAQIPNGFHVARAGHNNPRFDLDWFDHEGGTVRVGQGFLNFKLFLLI